MKAFDYILVYAPIWIERMTLVFLILIAMFAIFESEHSLRVAFRLFREQHRKREFRKMLLTTVLIFAAFGPGGYYTGELLRQIVLP